jgi:hypothetical protein
VAGVAANVRPLPAHVCGTEQERVVVAGGRFPGVAPRVLGQQLGGCGVGLAEAADPQRLAPRLTAAVLRSSRHLARLDLRPKATRSARGVAPGWKTVGSLPITRPPLTRLRLPLRTFAARLPATLTSKTATSLSPRISVQEPFGATAGLDAAPAAGARSARTARRQLTAMASNGDRGMSSVRRRGFRCA